MTKKRKRNNWNKGKMIMLCLQMKKTYAIMKQSQSKLNSIKELLWRSKLWTIFRWKMSFLLLSKPRIEASLISGLKIVVFLKRGLLDLLSFVSLPILLKVLAWLKFLLRIVKNSKNWLRLSLLIIRLNSFLFKVLTLMRNFMVKLCPDVFLKVDRSKNLTFLMLIFMILKASMKCQAVSCMRDVD